MSAFTDLRVGISGWSSHNALLAGRENILSETKKELELTDLSETFKLSGDVSCSFLSVATHHASCLAASLS